MGLSGSWNKLSKRKKIQTGLFGVVVLFLVCVAAWQVAGLFAC